LFSVLYSEDSEHFSVYNSIYKVLYSKCPET